MDVECVGTCTLGGVVGGAGMNRSGVLISPGLLGGWDWHLTLSPVVPSSRRLCVTVMRVNVTWGTEIAPSLRTRAWVSERPLWPRRNGMDSGAAVFP